MTAKAETRSLTSFLRKLRPMLPGKVEKLDKEGLRYRIDGKAEIEISYYCRWERPEDAEKKKTARSCYPASVKVYHSNEHLNKVFGEKPTKTISGYRYQRQYTVAPAFIFKPRSYRRGKNGDIGLESIATAVQKCCASVDAWIANEYQRRADKKKEGQLVDAEIKRLKAILPEGFTVSKNRNSSATLHDKDENINIHILLNREEGESEERTISYGVFFGSEWDNDKGVDGTTLRQLIDLICSFK
jgi:hypothetical protein